MDNQPQKAVMTQTDFFTPWISGDAAMPKEGQRTLQFFEAEGGEMVGPITIKALYIDGKYFYRKILWWMPIPSLPLLILKMS